MMSVIFLSLVASNDKRSHLYMQEGLNLILQCSANVYSWSQNQIPVQSAEMHVLVFGVSFFVVACLFWNMLNLLRAYQLNLQFLINTNLNT